MDICRGIQLSDLQLFIIIAASLTVNMQIVKSPLRHKDFKYQKFPKSGLLFGSSQQKNCYKTFMKIVT